MKSTSKNVCGAKLVLLTCLLGMALSEFAVKGSEVPEGSYTVKIPKGGILEDAELSIHLTPSQSIVVDNAEPNRVLQDPLEIDRQVYVRKGNSCKTDNRVDWAELFPEAPEKYPFAQVTTGHQNGASSIFFRMPSRVYAKAPASYCFLLKDVKSEKQYTVFVETSGATAAFASYFAGTLAVSLSAVFVSYSS
ncbi:UNVERIFIED_CONTAM: transmembrane protein, putative [Hammondia hammondi]|eukprot:XP_008884181.1 transmembrane protein, putative [Hammondia hammondi]